jgi:hypothetical protein
MPVDHQGDRRQAAPMVGAVSSLKAPFSHWSKIDVLPTLKFPRTISFGVSSLLIAFSLDHTIVSSTHRSKKSLETNRLSVKPAAPLTWAGLLGGRGHEGMRAQSMRGVSPHGRGRSRGTVEHRPPSCALGGGGRDPRVWRKAGRRRSRARHRGTESDAATGRPCRENDAQNPGRRGQFTRVSAFRWTPWVRRSSPPS